MREDYKIISEIIESGSKVLDLGCGDGELMSLLTEKKNVRVQGIELDDSQIYKCVEKGLSVFHGDIDSGLLEYPDKSFDYVILNQTMQQAKKADFVIQESLRVGRKLIVGFPNFAYFKAPNLHFLTASDFKGYCADKGIRILKAYYLGQNGRVSLWPNLFSLNAIFLLER